MLDSLERIKKQGLQPTSAPAPAAAAGAPIDIFASIVSPQPSAQAGVKKIPLDKIDPWKDEEGRSQPFKLYPMDKLLEMAENIKQNGLITPVRLRISPFDATRYQTLAGHNRILAAQLAGMDTIDAIVENVDDDTARMILVDSNLYQREKILPSEKAFAYKLRLESMKKQAGRKAKKNCAQVEHNFADSACRENCAQVEHNFEGLRSVDILAAENEESRAQIQRYISLTRLIQPLLDMVDSEAIPFTAGVSLASLSVTAQERLWRVMEDAQITAISRTQAEALRDAREDLDREMSETLILQIFGVQQGEKKPKPQSIRFELDVAPEVVKKYRKDEELQLLVAATIRKYIEEKEMSAE